MVLATRIAEIVGRIEAGRHRLRGVHGQSLVDQQLPEGRPAPGLPVVVAPARFGNKTAQVACARGRRVADGVGQLVRHPERDEVGREPHAICLGIDPAREVLGTNEGDPAPPHHELARIGTPHADHQIAVGGLVDPEQVVRPARRFFHELDRIS